MFFLFDVRAGLIVATTIPLALLFAFICLDLKSIPANLLSIGAIDFGILVDGAGKLPAWLLGKPARPMQNGLVQFYALSMMLAMAVLLVALLWRQA